MTYSNSSNRERRVLQTPATVSEGKERAVGALARHQGGNREREGQIRVCERDVYTHRVFSFRGEGRKKKKDWGLFRSRCISVWTREEKRGREKREGR